MTVISEAQLQPLLQAVVDPGSGRTLGEAKALKSVQVDGANVSIDIELGYPAASQHAALYDVDQIMIQMAGSRKNATTISE